MDIKKAVKQWLIEKQNIRYAKQLQKKRITYSEWICEKEKCCEDIRSEEGNLPAEDNLSAERNADYVVFVASEGQILHNTLENITRYFKEKPDVQILYGDEDVYDAADKKRKAPWFKQGWSPDMFRQAFYFGSVVAVRKALVDELAAEGFDTDRFSELKEYGNRVTDMEGYREWMMAGVGKVGGFIKDCKTIAHIPEMWFSCVSEEEQKRFWDLPFENMREIALQDSVSVIIPSKDNPEILKKCIESCIEVTDVSQVEIVVVDNGSSEENRKKIETFIGERKEDITYLYEPMEFHFSKMCNLGAAKAKGRYLLFLNDDVELCQAGTIEEMVSLAKQEYTGAVGLKLLYPGTDKIQHAGITNLPMGPVHKMQYLKDSTCYYYGANRGNRNVLAVTAACLMVDRNKFEEVSGFSSELRVAFNDVDFCYSLYEKGYANVCVNSKFAYHHESLSRGADEAVEKLERLIAERDKLYDRHPNLVGVDPYYSVHFNRDGLDTRIRPGYETSQNAVQSIKESLPVLKQQGHRFDACLMVRVEDFRDTHAVGYGVVLGDNNACYEKKLLFGCVNDKTAECDWYEPVYAISLQGQYRPDLEENMPDQVNVALSGFDVEIAKGVLASGTYRIGMSARNRVSGLKLVNWTNRYVDIKG